LQLNKFKIILLVSIILILYFISLSNFIFNIDKDYITKINVNNIVVLTGNSGRLTFGLELMNNDIKSRMLITGVAKGVKYSDIIKNKYLSKDRIDLGYNAKNTLGNALEVFGWLKKHNINDIILVTDNWHMQRTLLLFKALMPNREIYPYALKSINFTLKDYIRFNNKTFFIYEEHIKYIVAHVQVIYLWLIN
jgi:uncharacterized SAM-binding protein YcdF (DUF218 family)